MGAFLRLSFATASLAAAFPAQSWVNRDPRPLLNNALSWDAWRERGVLVAEVASRMLVYEWDGIRWTPGNTPAVVPPPSTDHRFVTAFDPVHRRTVLIVAGVQQTWAWNGQTWAMLPPPPFVPRWTAMAFDDANGRLVVFDTSAILGSNQTWHFDGATWTQVAANLLFDDILVKAAHDPVRARTVLRAGTTTFEWDGVAWIGGATAVDPPTNCPPIFDPQRGKVIVPTTGSTHYEWNGIDWAPYAAPAPNIATIRPGMYFYDHRRAGLMLYDDWSGATLRLEASGWVMAQLLPGTGGGLQLSADVAHSQVVAVQTPAILNPNPPPTTLRWTPSGWHSLGHLGLPLRLGAAQADRDLAGVVYRFAGMATPGFSETDELYGFDGTSWSLVTAPNAPAPRASGALAADTTRQRLVAFGGRSGTTYWNDTREFDSTQWWPKYPAHAPSPRVGHAMCFSPSLGRVFLFGGWTAPQGAMVLDFWAWDGTDWSQLPAPPIGPVTWFALASHDAAGTVVLTAGSATTPTWSWNGTSWSQLPDAPFGANVLTAEPRLGTVFAPLAGALLTTQPAAVTAFGSGCAGSAGTPTLRPFGRPGLGNASYAFEIETATTSPAAMIAAHGFATASVPLPGGCALLVTPVVFSVVLAPAGFGAFPLAIPDELALRGATIFTQGAVLDPTAPAGFVTTHRLASTIAD
jgi:hypothetical protein